MMVTCRCVLDPARKFGTHAGSAAGVCTCCGGMTDVVRLPAGGGSIFNCASCLTPVKPQSRRKTSGQPSRQEHRERSRFRSDMRTVYLPASLVLAIERDPTQIPNFHASPQFQKMASRVDEEYD